MKGEDVSFDSTPVLADGGARHTCLDPLKVDIGGFEYESARDLVAGQIHLRQLFVEFHRGMYGIIRGQTLNVIVALHEGSCDFFCVSPSSHEYGFVAEVPS